MAEADTTTDEQRPGSTGLKEFAKKFGKHSAVYSIGDVLTRMVAFLLIPVYTRFLTPSDYGILEIIGLVSSIIVLFMLHGMLAAFSRTYLYETKDDYAQQRTLVTTISVYLAAIAAVVFAALYLLAPIIDEFMFKGRVSRTVILLVFLSCAVESVWGIPFAIFRNNFQSIRFVTLKVVGFTIQMLLSIYFVVVLRMGVMGVVLGALISKGVICGIGFGFIREYFVPRFSKTMTSAMWRFGLPLVPTALGWMIFQMSDRMLLLKFAPPDQLGQYALGAKFAMIIQFVLIFPVRRVYFAMYYPLAKDDPEAAREILGRFFSYLAAISAGIGIAVAVFSPALIRIMAPADYWPATTVVPFLCGAAILNGLIHAVNAGINISGATKYLPPVVFTAAAINIGLNYVMIPKYGMLGAAIATLLAYVVYFVLALVVNQRVYTIRYEYARITRLSLASLIAMGFALSVQTSDLVGSIAIGIAACLIFVATLLGARFFSQAELVSVRKQIAYRLRR